jgi:tripartite-type tricarboxylate transporter receptor subunit TctC
MPDLPTTKELGLPSVIMENWYGVLAPAGTPASVREKLEKALLAIVASPSIQQRIADNGLHDTLDHQAFAALLKQEFAEWPAEIQKLGITAE